MISNVSTDEDDITRSTLGTLCHIRRNWCGGRATALHAGCNLGLARSSP